MGRPGRHPYVITLVSASSTRSTDLDRGGSARPGAILPDVPGRWLDELLVKLGWSGAEIAAYRRCVDDCVGRGLRRRLRRGRN